MYANKGNIEFNTWDQIDITIMIDPKDFYDVLLKHEINFFSGVPDSLLKDICAYISDNTESKNNIIAANEGASIAIAAGYHLGTGKIPLVYMQNSGLGNAVNPLTSLTDKKVYSIPMVLMIGWRGEPGVKDEPQHVKQGLITLKLLETLEIPSIVVESTINYKKNVSSAIQIAKKESVPVAIVVREGTFSHYKLRRKNTENFTLSREDAIFEILNNLQKNDVIVTTTGKTSRELFEIREQRKEKHFRDFLTVGSMGHASQIALGISLNQPNRKIYCFDGDGSAIMHLGSFGIIGQLSPKNFVHIIFNNGAHDSVGGQPTIGNFLNFSKIGIEFNYHATFSISDLSELHVVMSSINSIGGPVLIEVKVKKGAREDLGRPTTSPIQNKISFMEFLRNV